MLARLIWQSWRDGGKMLLLPVAIAAILLLGVASVVTLTGSRGEIAAASWLATSLFVPALYGALAFSADQRRGSHRFLAEHAARPRYVWLARHVVWLGTLLVLAMALWFAVTSLTALLAQFLTRRDLEEFVQTGHELRFPDDTPIVLTYVIDGASLTWCGILTAYGLGQLCSILLRSEILAAFIALLLSMVVTAWAAVLFAWQLSAWVFLFPLAAAFMLATWLRAPDWIAGRNNWQTWLKLALPVIATLLFIGVALPRMRLLQLDIPADPATKRLPQRTDLEPLLASHRQGDTPEALETAAMYQRAVDSLESGSPEQAVNQAIEAAKRPTCRFDFNIGQFTTAPWRPTIDQHPGYGKLNQLLNALWQVEPHEPFDRLLAALRMSAHMRSAQPSIVVFDQLNNEKLILAQIENWVASEQRTKDDLKAALAQLTAHFRQPPSLQSTLIADHLIIRDEILDKEPSLVVSQRSNSLLVHLAWLANQLPWERERALLALRNITLLNTGDAEDLTSGMYPNEIVTTLRKWIRPRYAPPSDPLWVIAQSATATSYRARLEYQQRTDVHKLYRAYCDNQVCRRAVVLQIALVMFRRDHAAYPDHLSQLVPDYLESVPLDPYSGQLFHYEAAGLDLPLRAFTESNFKRIDSYTPLFWSVSSGNTQLRRREERTLESDPNVPDALPHVVLETTYRLEGEGEWRGEPAFAFPLPK